MERGTLPTELSILSISYNTENGAEYLWLPTHRLARHPLHFARNGEGRGEAFKKSHHMNPFRRLSTYFRRTLRAINPGSGGMRAAALGLVTLAGLIYVIFVIRQSIGPLLGFLPVLLALLLLGGLLLLLGQGIAWVIGLLNKIPWLLRWTLIGALALLLQSAMSYQPGAALLMAGVIALAGLLLGWGIWTVIRRYYLTIPQMRGGYTALTLGVLLLGGLAAWWIWPGVPAAEVANAALLSETAPARMTLPDPSQPGPYAVRTLTYGSGTDRYRPEFAEGAAIKTEPVDGSKLLDSSWTGFNGNLRTLLWGITPDKLPLNGRVWYPDSPEQGPFPLVLVVHGNHRDLDFSDPGYAYLGELMAARGFIFVSVDQNFINGSPTDFPNGMRNENDARGWLLLEHLRLFHQWNEAAENPFRGMVDTDNIAVMGHSRGGEAAAIAAIFNRLPHYPENAGQSFNYNYNIRAVVAIAPIDGQYSPAGRGTTLTDVNYFVLHGSHDADVTSFSGMNQYERVRFTGGEGVKAALYVYRANHGQFNSTWGQVDSGGWTGPVNRASLLPKAEQEQVAKVTISAFLEATLHGEEGYLPLFYDSRMAGEGWLPDTVYINRFDRAGYLRIATFDEDVDLATGTLPGSTVSGTDLDIWREGRINTKWGGAETNAVTVGWNEDGTSAITVTLPDDWQGVDASASLIFNVADANQDPAAGKGAADSEGEKPEGRQPIDISVVLEDAQGNMASLPLGRYKLVQPQLEAQLWKLKLFERSAPSEPVMQSVVIPLADFVEASAGFDVQNIRAIRFVFNRTPRGSLIIDSVGFRE